MAKKTKVALIFGGRSAEHEVSLKSAAAVYRNLAPEKYDVLCIHIDKTGFWRMVDSPLRLSIKPGLGKPRSFLPWGNAGLDRALSADIYFPVLHGPYGEDGTIQGLLEMADVPYVGAGVLGSSVGMDKAVAKSLFKEQGLPVVPWITLLENDWAGRKKAVAVTILRKFPFPVFVKPANLGSSVGISKAKSPAGLVRAIDKAFLYDGKVLVEKGINGRELECSVLGNEEPSASLPGEVLPSREFYDYADKYLDGKTGFRIPADLQAPLVRRIRKLAVEAFRAIGLSGFARVDFFYEENRRRLYVNEVNTIPGFTEISMYPKLWEASGLSFPSLVDELIRLGFEKHNRKKRCTDWNAR
jgi:D-alanine-D-alanine ligase